MEFYFLLEFYCYANCQSVARLLLISKLLLRKFEESNPKIYHLLNCESRIKNKIESNVEALRKFGIKKRKIRKIGIERKLEESNPEILLSFIKLRK